MLSGIRIDLISLRAAIYSCQGQTTSHPSYTSSARCLILHHVGIGLFFFIMFHKIQSFGLFIFGWCRHAQIRLFVFDVAAESFLGTILYCVSREKLTLLLTELKIRQYLVFNQRNSIQCL